MARGKKTGGRQKGTPNKNTAERFADLIGAGITPLEYMLQVLRDPSVEHARRQDMAKAAAPYLHPRLAQTEISGNADKPLEHKLRIEFVRPQET